MRGLLMAATLALWSGEAMAADPAADLLAGTRWGQISIVSDFSTFTPGEIEGAARRACDSANIGFRQSDSGHLVKLDFVSGVSATEYPKSEVKTQGDEVVVEAYYAADRPTVDQTFVLWRGGELLTVKGSLFGDWHYARCAVLGEKTYSMPARSQPRGGR